MSSLSQRKRLPTQAYLRQRLDYDPTSGIFVWLPKPGDDRLTKSWNGRYAGKEAGYIDEGYRLIHLDELTYQAANLAWVYVTGSEPEGLVDHRDCRSSNNAFENLREADEFQNNCNRRSSAASGLKGAYLVGGKWHSAISRKGQVYRLGSFPTADAAHRAYVEAAQELHGEFAREQ
jgi:hypothetical protein